MLSLRRNRSARLRATMRAAGVVLLGALLTGCGSFQPAPTETRVVASGEFEVSIEQGLMVINAVINGEHPVRMVLDTGADATVLTPAAVERIPVPSVAISTARVREMTLEASLQEKSLLIPLHYMLVEYIEIYLNLVFQMLILLLNLNSKDLNLTLYAWDNATHNL